MDDGRYLILNPGLGRARRQRSPIPSDCRRATPDTGLLPLREQDLAQLWENGALPPAALVTLEGTPLHVVYRGRRNNGAGPDFRDAVIALPDGRLLHGDVELHLRAVDFRHHGHHRDPAYNQVILHLVLRADTAAETLLGNGRRARVIALDPWLAARAAEIRAMLEQPALWREPCQSAVERLGAEDVAEVLVRLGERRLRAKAAALRGRAPAVALYEALLRTLGHGPQQAAWLHLGQSLTLTLLDSVVSSGSEPVPDLEALFLGAAGLLPTAGELAALPAADRAAASESRRLWLRHGGQAATPIGTGGPRRPANHPARRLAGLARLLGAGVPALLDCLRAVLLAGPRREATLVDLLTVPADGPWRERCLPWSAVLPAPPAPLIGAGKALELAINAALPVLLATAERERDQRLARATVERFHALPSPAPYGRTAHLTRALRSGDAGLIRGANRSQGALHLFAQYCTQGGCGRCPLS